MPIYTLTFGSQYSHTRHPFFGDYPALPYGYGYVDAPTEYDARAVTIAAFGQAWSMLHPGDVAAQEAQDPGWSRFFPRGLLFTLRPDPAGLPVLTFRDGSTRTIQEDQ